MEWANPKIIGSSGLASESISLNGQDSGDLILLHSTTCVDVGRYVLDTKQGGLLFTMRHVDLSSQTTSAPSTLPSTPIHRHQPPSPSTPSPLLRTSSDSTGLHQTHRGAPKGIVRGRPNSWPIGPPGFPQAVSGHLGGLPSTSGPVTPYAPRIARAPIPLITLRRRGGPTCGNEARFEYRVPRRAI